MRAEINIRYRLFSIITSTIDAASVTNQPTIYLDT